MSVRCHGFRNFEQGKGEMGRDSRLHSFWWVPSMYDSYDPNPHKHKR